MSDLFKDGMAYFKEGKLNQAIEAFDAEVKLDKNNHKAWNALGVTFSKNGRYSDAATCFENALICDPGNAVYKKNRDKNTGKIGNSLYLPISNNVISALTKRNLSSMEGLTDDTRKKVIDVLTKGITDGIAPRKMIPDLMKLGYDSNRAEMIARTETMYALNEGAKKSYRESGIEYVQWLSSVDDRTCNTFEIPLPDGSICYGGCAEMDGKVFHIDNAPAMPAHEGCRCAWSPDRGPEKY